MKTDCTYKRFMTNTSDNSHSTTLMNRKSRQQKLCKHLHHYKWPSHLLVIRQKLTNPVLLSNHYLRTVDARYFNAVASESASKHAIRCQRYRIVLSNVCL
ncbi:hypothetical protein CDAR_264501 [Caerostris darwini]|uniref:Uncharacterized protein n=1 Tax=Caerostris darwini TaxID=1538125 RepID=A0AAV4TJ96_9ARAC|nr:hypothetical protein CDAR_264501 [Caerostris darwini]